MTKRVAVTGSSGLIGGALRRHLEERGDDVLRLVRRTPTLARRGRGGTPPEEVSTTPRWMVSTRSSTSPASASVTDGGRPGTSVRSSVPAPTPRAPSPRPSSRTASAPAGPSGSSTARRSATTATAVTSILTEASAPGHDFLSGVVTRWEGAAQPAADAGHPGRVRPQRPGHGPRGRRLQAGRPPRPARPRRADGLGPRVVAVDHPRRRGAAADCTSSTTPSSSGPFNLAAPGPRDSGRSPRPSARRSRGRQSSPRPASLSAPSSASSPTTSSPASAWSPLHCSRPASPSSIQTWTAPSGGWCGR